ncbi:glycosyltransferase [Terriglobus aquaticus]|uniref:Glycosyltransferase n=1 Tax=Terriglobus aquaticus TaxID=940139 RepID=A0ABW9KNU6_9BACT|nr:glycosyltransferase [Terriglobus aquaticus]
MRILMTTDTVGGVWTQTRELVAGLLRADPYIRIFLFAVGSTCSPEQLGWLRAMRERNPGRFDSAVHSVPLEWEQRNDQVDPFEPRLLSIARTFAPEVFHSSQFCYGALPVDCPRLVVAHSDVLSWFREVHGTEPEPSPWIDRYVSLVRHGVEQASAVVAPTRWMLQAFRDGFPAPAHTRVIYNGVSFRPRPPQERLLQAVTAGRLWDQAKNVALLQRLQHPAVPLLVAGASQHENETLKWKGSEAIQLLGNTSRRDLLSLFAQSAMYLSTAIYEPFGLSALEAARSGCALLALDIESMREVWGNAALYFRTVEELAAAIEHLASSPRALALAQQQAEATAAQYTRERMADSYRALYRELMDSPRGNSAVA